MKHERIATICAVLTSGLLCLQTAAAQAPATGATPETELAERAAQAAQADATPSAEFADWIQLCVQHLASPDDNVRAGATLALRFAGANAKPALEEAASSPDPTLSAAAKRVLDQLARPEGAAARSGRPRPTVTRQGHASSRVVAALDLDDERRAAVETILDDFDERRQVILDQLRAGTVDRSQIVGQLDALTAEIDGRVDEVLDDEEMARYRSLMPSAASARSAEQEE